MKLNINIPSTLNEITLRQYKTFLNIQATIKDEKFLSVKLIEIFCKIKPSDVMLLKVKDSEMISNSINKLFDDKPALVTRFKINNKEYGFHPQLDELTLGEYVDLDTYIGDWENMEKAMSVLYRPIIAKLKGKYTISEYEIGKEDELLDMPMDAVLSSIFFFWNLGLDLSKTITDYLEEEEIEALMLDQTLTESMDGFKAFSLYSLNQILEDLKISQN
tara:strand:- start:1522 stop:2175 length:654 start_codon:yes stop_codon:yes gene_type:complete